jgi:hypothetical protein
VRAEGAEKDADEAGERTDQNEGSIHRSCRW